VSSTTGKALSVFALIGLIVGVSWSAAEEDPAAACDLESGRRTYMKCLPCHSSEKGGPHVVGPNLYGIIGRKAGSVPDYKYSGPFRTLEFTWERANLDLYLQDPARFVGGNWMSFTGLKRLEDREAVICYLEGSGSD
jgi:cytochrome c